jgi:hypothetical protein
VKCWLAVAVLSVSCGSPARDDARDSLVQQLRDGGLDRPTAECVVDAFFKGKTNDELKGFFERPTLTADERSEFARLGRQCQAGSSATVTTP